MAFQRDWIAELSDSAIVAEHPAMAPSFHNLGKLGGWGQDPAEPGFRKFILQPVPDRRVGHVSARYRSPYGEIRSDWRYDGDTWSWRFVVPPNTVATVILDGKTPETFASGVHEITASFHNLGKLGGWGLVRQDPVRIAFAPGSRDYLSVFGGEKGLRELFTVRVRLADGTMVEDDGEVEFVGNEVNAATDTIPVFARVFTTLGS